MQNKSNPKKPLTVGFYKVLKLNYPIAKCLFKRDFNASTESEEVNVDLTPLYHPASIQPANSTVNLLNKIIQIIEVKPDGKSIKSASWLIVNRAILNELKSRKEKRITDINSLEFSLKAYDLLKGELAQLYIPDEEALPTYNDTPDETSTDNQA